MTLEETGAIMDVLKTAYPRYYKDVSEDEKFNASCLWAEMFSDESVQVVIAAVKALIVTDEKGFPPHIGAVKAKIRQITLPKEMTEGEAWMLISKAISNSGYNSKTEYERLPPVLQRLVGSPGQLKQWALMDTETVQSIVASNIMRSYKAQAKNEREYQALPSDIKEFAAKLVESMPQMPQLGEGDYF